MKNLLKFVLLVFLILTFLTGCEEKSTENDDENNDQVLETVDGYGNIQEYNQIQASDIQILAGLNEGSVQNDSYEVDLNVNAVQLIRVLDENNQPLLMKIANVDDNPAEIDLNAETTAEALLFMAPMFVTSNKDEYSSLMQQIHQTGSFSAMVATIENQLNSNTFSMDEDNLELATAFGDVYVEMMTALENSRLNNFRDFFPHGTINGLELIDVDEEGSDIEFRIKNYAKRWISVYIDKYSENSQDIASSSECWIPSTEVSIWNIISGIFGGEFFETSDNIAVPKEDYSQILVNAYGLGLSNCNLLEMTDSELERIFFPAVYSIAFDIVFPTVEIMSGLNFTVELRGRPSVQPVTLLIRAIVDNLKNAANLEPFAEGLATGNFGSIISRLVSVSFNTIIDHPPYITAIINNVLQTNISSSIINHIFAPLRVIRAVFNAVNLGYALGSVISSEAITTFRFDIDDINESDVVAYGAVIDAYSNNFLSDCSVEIRDQNNMIMDYTITDNSGSYSFECEQGQYNLRFSKYGYRTVDLDINVNSSPDFFISNAWMIPYQTGSGSLSAYIYDATNLNEIPYVDYVVRVGNLIENGLIIQQGTTDDQGHLYINNIASGVYTIFLDKTDYISSQQVFFIEESQENSIDCSMSPDLQVDGYRIVLTWNDQESDLDSHLYTPSINGYNYHVYWSNKGSLYSPPYCELDVDDTYYEGPETISISQIFPGTYSYSVYNYSNHSNITNSAAHVALYGNQGLIGTWDIPPSGSGRWWNIFTIDGTSGEITVINTITSRADDEDMPQKN